MSTDNPTNKIRESSPSQTAISESKLNKKALCDYVINVAEGCRHGCRFCYVPSTPALRMDPGGKLEDAGVDDARDEWGEYVLYRDDVVQNTADDCRRLDGKWKTTDRGQGVVGLSFATDCYMDDRVAELTKGAVTALVGHNRTARILTRNPTLLESLHGEFYGSLESGSVTIGSSIPSLDSGNVAVMEPNSPPVEQRLRGLEALRERHPSVPLYVSMSPTYPTQDYSDVRQLLKELSDRLNPSVVFHEPINPRGGNLDACIEYARANNRDELARGLETITDRDEWRRYALQQLANVQRAATEVEQSVHLWPDTDLVENAPTAEQREWCQAWRDRPSPERIGDGEACLDLYPEIPEIDAHEQGTLERYRGNDEQ